MTRSDSGDYKGIDHGVDLLILRESIFPRISGANDINILGVWIRVNKALEISHILALLRSHKVDIPHIGIELSVEAKESENNGKDQYDVDKPLIIFDRNGSQSSEEKRPRKAINITATDFD